MLSKTGKRQLYHTETYLIKNCESRELAVAYVYCCQFKDLRKEKGEVKRHEVPKASMATHFLTYSNPDFVLFNFDKRLRSQEPNCLRRYYHFQIQRDLTQQWMFLQAFEAHLANKMKDHTFCLHYDTGFRTCLINDVRQMKRRVMAAPTAASLRVALNDNIKRFHMKNRHWFCETEKGKQYRIGFPVKKKSPSKSSVLAAIQRRPQSSKYKVNSALMKILRCEVNNNDYLVEQIIPCKTVTFDELVHEVNLMELLKLLMYRHANKLDTRVKNIAWWDNKMWSLHEDKSKSKREHFRDFEWGQLMVEPHRKQQLDVLWDRLQRFAETKASDIVGWVKACQCNKLNFLLRRMAKKIPQLNVSI